MGKGQIVFILAFTGIASTTNRTWRKVEANAKVNLLRKLPKLTEWGCERG
jgi:hypothetical protein